MLEIKAATKMLADKPQEDGFCTVTPADAMDEAASVACKTLKVYFAEKN